MFERKNLPAALLLLLAFGMYTRPSAQNAVERGAVEAERKPTLRSQAEPVPARSKIAALLAGFDTATVKSDRPPAGELAAVRLLRPKFLVATVADPSFLPATFDYTMESIERAAESEGYLLDRFFLPWEVARDEGKKEGQKEPLPAFVRAARYSCDEPGVILFRNAEFGLSPLVVFLVGETPKTGLQKEAFLASLTTIVDLARDATTLPKIRVLGPSFSGTIPSLGIAIAAAHRKWPEMTFDVATGSATRTSNAADLGRLTEGAEVSYSSVVENDSVTEDMLMAYFAAKGVRRSQIASLSESGTAFGAGFRERGPREHPLSLTFPPEIARLRAAYREDVSFGAIWADKASPIQQPYGVEVRFKEAPTASDGLPALSTELTPLRQELTIGNLAAVIRQAGVQLVGVSASDPWDAAFVSKLIQKSCPDVRLFMLESEVLFQHTSPKLSFYGMLMASTYPLVSFNQFWQMPAGTRQLTPFPNQSAEGTYNAFCLLLGAQAPLLEYSHPTRESARPPVWLTVVGRDGLWPVKVLGEQAKNSSLADWPGEPPERELPAPARSWWTLFWLLTVAYFWHAWSLGYVYIKPGEDKEDRMAAFNLPPVFSFHTFCNLFLADSVRLALYFPFWAITLAYLRPGGVEGRVEYIAAFGAASLVLVLLVALPLVCVLRAEPLGLIFKRRWSPQGTALVVLCVVVPAAVMFLSAWKWFDAIVAGAWRGDADTVMLLVRAVNPGSGVSPLVPFVTLAFAVTCWVSAQFGRLRMAHTRDPGFPHIVSGDAVLASAWVHARRLQGEFRRSATGWQLLGAGAAVAVIGLSLVPLSMYQSVEDRWFDWFTYVLLWAVCFLVCLGALRLHRYWGILRSLTDCLSLPGLHRMFARLAAAMPEVRWQVMHPRGAKRPMEALMVNSFRRLPVQDRMQKAAQFWLEDITARPQDLRTGYRTSLRRLNRVLNLAAGRTMVNVMAASAAAGSGGSGGPAPFREEPGEAATEFLALRLAVFVRYAAVQIWNQVSFLAIGTVALVLTINSYPFQPHRSLSLVVAIIFAISAGVFLTVLAQMDRHPVLSLLARTKPGRLSWNFARWGLLYGMVPLITVVASLFPDIGRQLAEWLSPSLSALR